MLTSGKRTSDEFYSKDRHHPRIAHKLAVVIALQYCYP